MRVLLISLVVFIILSFTFIKGFDYFYHSPLSHQEGSIKYVLASGTGARTMIYQLKDKGVLTSLQAQALMVIIRFQGVGKSLKSGEYTIAFSITPQKLLEKFIKGEAVQYSFTLIEGKTFEDVMKILSDLPFIQKTLREKSVEEIMVLLGEPQVKPEGLFFPETYFYTLNTTDLNLLKRARQLMRDKLMAAWAQRQDGIGLTSPYEALILASIIEKEAAVDDERCLISGVFHRRLAKNMPLQADPTVIYGLGKNYSGRLTAAELKQETVSNTYLHKGLPPTPISMPGIKSIHAALHPDSSDALYFVAKGDGSGSHYFSATLEEHNDAVKQYQRQKELRSITPPHNNFYYRLGEGIGIK